MDAAVRRRRVRLALLASTLLLSACAWLVRLGLMSPFRIALPRSATDVHEWTWSEAGPLSQDHTYLLKARITQEEYAAYLRELPFLTPYSASMPLPAGVEGAWDQTFDQPWWDPPSGLSGAHVELGHGSWTVVRYASGWLYVSSGNI